MKARIAKWYDVPGLAAEQRAARDLNAAPIEELPFVPTGFYLGYQASRTSLTGVVNAPFPVASGVRKA